MYGRNQDNTVKQLSSNEWKGSRMSKYFKGINQANKLLNNVSIPLPYKYTFMRMTWKVRIFRILWLIGVPCQTLVIPEAMALAPAHSPPPWLHPMLWRVLHHSWGHPVAREFKLHPLTKHLPQQLVFSHPAGLEVPTLAMPLTLGSMDPGKKTVSAQELGCLDSEFWFSGI